MRDFPKYYKHKLYIEKQFLKHMLLLIKRINNLVDSKRRLAIAAVSIAMMAGSLTLATLAAPANRAQACANTPDPAKGTSTQTISVQSAGTYRIWSRIKAPDTTNNSYYLQIDGGCSIVVGDSASIPTNTWTWINYQDGSTSSLSTINLTAGSHQLVTTGREPGVGVDRVELLADNTCTPTGTGDNCTPAVDTAAPSTPTGVTASGISTSQIKLGWTAATDNVGVTGYRIYRNGSSTALATVAAPTLTYTDSGLAAATDYTYTITALDAAGNESSHSISVKATTVSVADTTSPTTPTGVSATAISSSKINLLWGAAADNVGVTAYRVYRNGSTTPLATVNAPNLSYSDSTVAAATTYTYTITALDAAGNESPHSATVTASTPAATDITPPSVPTGLTSAGVTTNSVSLSWAASTDGGGSGLAGYHVYRNNVLVSSPTGTTYTDTGLASGTTYTYSVSAYDNAANGSAASAPITATTTASTTDTTPPTAATNLQATSVGTSSVSLGWGASTDNVRVAGYRIWRGDGNWANWALVGTVSASTLSFTNTGLVSGTSYTYGIRAYDAAGNIAAGSNTILVTTKSTDTTAPSVSITAPTSGASVSGATSVAATASDNVGVTGVQFKLDGTVLGSLIKASPYTYSWDTKTVANGNHILTAIATDAAGNTTTSTAVTISVNNTTPDTTPPSTPTGLAALAASSSQVNLFWSPATDNVAVTGYRIYRNGSSTPLTTAASTSFGDTGLSAATTYSYTVAAVDAAGNASPQSIAVSVTTPAQASTVTVIGVVSSKASGQAISGAYVYTGNHATASGSATAYTNSLGQYVLSGIKPDSKHNYHYTATGFRSRYFSWSFPAGTVTENVQL